MISIPQDKLNEFVQAAHLVGRHGLLRCSSGNLSIRLDEEHFLVSASGSWLAELRPDQVVAVRTADMMVVNDKRPSVETGFHAGVLRQRPDCDVVLHFQTTAATTLACRRDLEEINFFLLPEMVYYIGPVGIVDYHSPGTEDLANAVIDVMASHDLAMLRNHGQIVVGKDIHEAIQKARFFELICEMLVHGGPNLQLLSAEAISHLRPKDGSRPTAV